MSKTVESNFPLFRLPENVIDTVVRTMGFLDIISFSFCTEATKSIVESFGMNSEGISLVFDHVITLEIRFSNNEALCIFFYGAEAENRRRRHRLIPLKTPKIVEVEYGIKENDDFLEEGNELADWKFSKKEGLGFGDWIRHMLSIFDCHTMPEIYFLPRSKKFYRKDIKTNLDDIFHDAVINVDDACSNKYHHKIYQTLKPITSLHLDRSPYEPCDLRRLITQNFISLTFGYNNLYTLDDLLLTNCEMIYNYEPLNLSVEDIRRFIKHWITGKTSRRLDHVHIELHVGVPIEVGMLLKGIQYTVVDEGREKMFKKMDSVLVRGGYDIKRRDGTLATITLGTSEAGNPEINLYIW